MSLDVFLVFNGNCQDALEFYTMIFKQEAKDIMSYGQYPEGSSDEDKARILYAFMPLFGQNMMFCDCPSHADYVKGNNVMLTLGIGDEEEMKRIFEALAEGGDVCMPLDKTFFSELFGQVVDKFGIFWQLSKVSG
jgi:PhnB protein